MTNPITTDATDTVTHVPFTTWAIQCIAQHPVRGMRYDIRQASGATVFGITRGQALKCLICGGVTGITANFPGRNGAVVDL